MASTGLNEESVEKRLMSVTNTQDSIQGLSLWIIHHKTHYARIVELWYKIMKKSTKPAHRLTLFYLCNDVVQTCKRKKALVFIDAFRTPLRQATALVRDAAIRPKVDRIFSIWEERQVFDKDFMTNLRSILDGKQPDGVIFKKPYSPREKTKDKSKLKAKEKAQEKAVSSVSEDMEGIQPADATLVSNKEEKREKELDAPSEETLAAFKPSDMIEKIKVYKNQAAEVDNNVQKLSHLKLDASSIEAIKQLKDRAHGNEFSTQFEESCLRLEEAVEGLEKMKAEEKDLMELLGISEHFYSQQHSEASIVATAYKNYGARLNTVKRKLDELMRSLPSLDDSPTPEAMSPVNTPPDLGSVDADLLDIDAAGIKNALSAVHDRVTTRGRVAITTTTRAILKPIPSIKALTFADIDMLSPVVSPDDSAVPTPGSSSLENRLASFLPTLQSGGGSNSIGEEHPIPVYIPQPLSSSASISGRRPSANKTLTESEVLFPEEEGGSTPLTDEQPTTPVMDEEPVSSPSPPPPPPPPLPPPIEKKKENPIDFLSRLISQGQRNKPEGSGGERDSVLETYARLTNRMKERADLKKGNSDSDNSASGGSPGPKSWAAWKAERAVEKGSVVEQPNLTIPPPLFPSFAVPPPIPPPVSPAPVSPLAVPPVIALPVPSPSLATPTSPFYEHTSPGQKENWPQAGDGTGESQDAVSSPTMDYPLMQGDVAFPSSSSKPSVSVKGILRANNNSVLRELTPSMDDPPASETPPVPPPPPPLNDARSPSQPQPEEGSAITTLGSNTKDDVSDFVEKMRRKSSKGNTPVYTPNPVRPNLMTLTPGGETEDQEEEEDEEEDESSSHIPVLSSVVRRVDPVEQRQTRQKEMHLLRDRMSNKYQEMYPVDQQPSSTSGFSHRGHTFHKERHYSRESIQDSYYVSSNYNYRDDRSYPYESQQPNSYYDPYSENNYEEMYNSYPYGQPPHNGTFHKHGNPRGSNHRSYRY